MTRGSTWIGVLDAAAMVWLAACGPATTRAVSPGAEGSRTPPRADASLLPRKLLFGNPDRGVPKLSPSGRYLAWLAPKAGVMNVYIAPRDDLASARAVTDEKNRPIPEFDWAFDNRHVLYSRDQDGDEDVHVFSVDVETSARTDLTPFEKTRGLILGLSQREPGVALLGMNDRDAQFHDAYRVDIASGKRELVLKNE